ncbi:BatA domain-containing protein [Winogradskyella poriferorum]|uniref:BatA domain-containing protein n=1 Tax=Winogradskyella poriferorum TaxID=307627 RepID=UPI003D646FAA
MQFKHPELLYALLLLIVPVIIHLFQLRRFQKVEFTNVKFLKAVKLQTRKSSQIKKWLTLVTRLLLLACAILAFAQPFIPKTDNFNDQQETVIYLDNSFSMQAKGQNGSLLNEAVQDIISTVSDKDEVSVFTNDQTFTNTSVKAIKKELINLGFTANQLSYDAVLLKGKQLFTSKGNSEKNLILVSDFQQKTEAFSIDRDSTYNISFVQPKSNLIANVSIDSVFINSSSAETIELVVRLKNFGEATDDLSVSLYNNDELLAKTAVSIENEAGANFTLANDKEINGRIQIEDAGLLYDNTFYFNIGQNPKIKVLSINEESDDSYLKRIYTDDEFDYISSEIDALNFNLIKDQDLVILNELESLSNALISALNEYKNDGGYILTIPSGKTNLNTYNELFNKLNLSILNTPIVLNKRVTSINYDHPILKNAFYTRVTNFQYPRVDQSYKFSSNSNSILAFEDGSVFLQGDNGSYAFASPINSENSNFKNSPLIVPVLYNIGKQSLKLPKLYYTIGNPNSVAVKATVKQDDILSLHREGASVIPPQIAYSKSVVMDIGEYPSSVGIYEIKNKEEILQNISFNYNHNESNIAYLNISDLNNVNASTDLSNTISTIKSNANVNALWKWFVIFALAFLILEMLILKYLK